MWFNILSDDTIVRQNKPKRYTMSNKNKKITFRENSEVAESLSALADAKGLQTSSMLRMMIREKLAADSASAK